MISYGLTNYASVKGDVINSNVGLVVLAHYGTELYFEVLLFTNVN